MKNIYFFNGTEDIDHQAIATSEQEARAKLSKVLKKKEAENMVLASIDSIGDCDEPNN